MNPKKRWTKAITQPADAGYDALSHTCDAIHTSEHYIICILLYWASDSAIDLLLRLSID